MKVALVMGRGGSESIRGKNLLPVGGRPLVEWPLRAALAAEKIDLVAVTTDCPRITEVASDLGVRVIERPADLSGATAQMADGILHALSKLGERVEYLVTMHANCATHPPGLIDRCLARLEEDPEADSCVSGVIDRAVHPFRTRRLNPEGELQPWLEIPSGTSSNRQSLEPCVILDGASRAMRVRSCFPLRGDPPFPYLGRRILLEENPGGRDVHDDADVFLTERFLEEHGLSDGEDSSRERGKR